MRKTRDIIVVRMFKYYDSLDLEEQKKVEVSKARSMN